MNIFYLIVNIARGDGGVCFPQVICVIVFPNPLPRISFPLMFTTCVPEASRGIRYPISAKHGINYRSHTCDTAECRSALHERHFC